jgi:hypothetical protein
VEKMSAPRTPSLGSSSQRPNPPRRRENLLISAFLALQIAIPLSYYLSARTYDERFSWRMFSTLRLRDCKVEVTEQVRVGGQEVPRSVNVERDVHVAWLRLLERMRSAVIDAYLERRCTTDDVSSVRFVCRCKDTDGTPLPAMERSLHCEASP